ncbi:MAG TPA: UDP-N-acetylmuramate dehydrogenase [Bacteroidales bacterium]|nr:UDP-N-acetylmuramate dehydrogenase [Bacteroidales bacterium]
MIVIEENYPLRSLNTFGIKASARYFAEATTPEDIRSVLSIFRDHELPKLIMGGGSNLLFTGDFNGIVYYPSIKGREIIKMNESNVWIKAYAGENWDQFVAYCVGRNWGGLENLSLIPGNVGACPVQNIGAYGVEVKDTIDSVEVIDIATGEIKIFANASCKFGYRDSIFKNEAANRYLVLSVTFRLDINPSINIAYKDVLEELKHYDKVDVATVRQSIINIRNRKLPDPEEMGNAGSFFKNPVIAIDHFKTIRNQYPEVPMYPVSEEFVKIPAAWLIQTAGWKGKREGNTGTHPNQPLVIVNYGGATGTEIVDFAKKIQESVMHQFNIELEMEVRIV